MNTFTMIKAAAALIKNQGYKDGAIADLGQFSDAAKHIKAASKVAPGMGSWNADLMASTHAAQEFGNYIWEQTIPGQLYALANQLPVGVKLAEIYSSAAEWLGEGRGAPVVGVSIVAGGTLKPHKIGSTLVTTRETIQLYPESLAIFQNAITSAAVKALDQQFWSSDAGDNVTPAGVLRSLKSQGTQSLGAALPVHAAAGNDMRRTALVCPVGFISSCEQPEITELEKLKIPVIISQYAKNAALIDCSKLSMYFSGTVVTDSTQAAIDMTNNSGMTADQTPTGAKSLVSMFQTNSVAIQANTYCTWSIPDIGTTAKPGSPSAITII